ncbi:AEC family transporter [Deinococcus rubellus]|uniref:AEC family transporter n=1 Tax=Deinococcus rubellus TaxID=1889240 RepID=UPI0031F08F2E
MDTLIFTLNAVLPAFLIIALGALAGKTMPGLDPLPIARLGTSFTTPALILGTVAKAHISASLALHVAVAYLTFLLVLGAVSYLLARQQSRPRRSGLMVTTLFANTGNMGLSLSLFAYGNAGLERSVIIFVLSMLLMFTVGPALLTGGGHFGRRLLDTWKWPPVWAAVGGILLNVTHFQLPLFLDRVLTLLGSAAVPLMLMLLGIQVYRTWTWQLGSINWLSVALKSLLSPLLAASVGWLIGLRGLELAVLVLTGALPTAVNVFGVAVEAGGDHDDVGRTIFVTTLLSIFTIGATILLLHPT